MTQLLFRDDAYLRECSATVVSVEEDGGLVLDRTVFYPQGGGQPGDSGQLRRADGLEIPIQVTRYGADRSKQLYYIVQVFYLTIKDIACVFYTESFNLANCLIKKNTSTFCRVNRTCHSA